ncbi:WD40-repeat-containing domain protein [Xylogone sp. PMI_703]|nr:WD40-repeat-containing domain protein [Xylogone sp. PMI_703]
MSSFEPPTQDEGYSEDPLTVSAESGGMQTWLSSIPVSQRTQYVMSLLDQLPTSEVCEIVRRLRPRLYIDFFQYLPPEVCLRILSFLDPISLINTARACREWNYLALDRKLWEHLYHLEGFRVIQSEVRKFEDSLNSGTQFTRPRLESEESEYANKRRATQRVPLALPTDGDAEMMDADVLTTKQESIFGPSAKEKMAVKSKEVDTDEVMMDSSYLAEKSSLKPLRAAQFPKNQRSAISQQLRQAGMPSHSSNLAVYDRSDNKLKLNWHYIYSQRRRLEANWEAEKYTNFQLPHPKHPEEAHLECIYTIQHSGRYLVSGSRDKTVRIWDLDTRRLVRPPLRAHSGSVLCLQFDADPEEDIIVSGSSDATIAIWKFSTGQVIQRLRKAHRESVLNVRFDKRVLVTCSKDKTIKIFNRKALHPGDVGYSNSFEAVNPVPTYLNNYGFPSSPSAGLPMRPPYTMIGCLEGHNAAVNAVQIYGDEVVSASGDRTVKVWNWPEQACTRTLIGHLKGIACVQYDGRRIVSGSSDNEVKVFDKESGLEVASLRAHTNLVRTVQAGFGDLPYSAEEDKEDARLVDSEYFRALDSGSLPRVQPRRGRPRNAGSRKPEDITAYGAKLPPGGGGGKFGRIVSGSYDETVIIWRRDKEGVWKAQHILRQEDAMIAAARASSPIRFPAVSQAMQPDADPQAQDQPSAAPFAPGSQAFYHHIIDITIPQGVAALRRALHEHPEIMQYPHLAASISQLPPSQRLLMTAAIDARIASRDAQRANSAEASSNPPLPQAQAQAHAHGEAQVGPGSHTAAQAGLTAPTAPQAPAGSDGHQQPHAQPQQPQPAPHHHHTHHAPTIQSNMSRVFKLQFDARRIICCSQTPVIVGWDFANGDEQIIEASRFFAPIE